jgi:crotonobetainyl-CoA:carnitine CoA-transferase CaiB-like acyl-CoA transferase
MGVRVLDFSRVMAGPYATRVLADFGAEVIKVQNARLALGADGNESEYFKMWNRNKKAITLDVEHPSGRRLALALAAISDVVVENFSPRVMTNWQLAYPDLRAVNPGVILLSMSAAGHSGPGRDWLGFGPTAHALSGFTYLTSFTEEEPIGLGVPYGDAVSGLYGALAVLAALEDRDRTGRGQHIDLSQYEAMCTMLGPDVAHASVTGEGGHPKGNGAGDVPAAPHGCYPCRGEDRWCVIAVFSDEEWNAFCRVMGAPSWADEFSTFMKRRERSGELDACIAEWTVQQSSEELVALLQRSGIAAGVVQDAEDLFRDPQLRARHFFLGEQPGDIVTDGNPIIMSGKRATGRTPAPRLGEHNRYVFRDLLGLSEAELSEHVRNGVVH